MTNYFKRLSIRQALLTGFGAVSLLMLLSVAVAVFTSSKLNNTIQNILSDQLPSTIQVLQITNASETMTSVSRGLDLINDERELEQARTRIGEAKSNLDISIQNIAKKTQDFSSLKRLTDTLRRNLEQLIQNSSDKIDLLKKQSRIREELKGVMLGLQQTLRNRIELLRADSNLMSYLQKKTVLNNSKTIEFARRIAPEMPAVSFYTEVEIINSRLLATLQEVSIPKLELSQSHIEKDVRRAGWIMNKLPPDLLEIIEGDFSRLKEIAYGGNGIFALKGAELELSFKNKKLVETNIAITKQIETLGHALVAQELEKVHRSGVETAKIQEIYVFYYTGAAIIGLVLISLLIYFFIMRKIIFRLSNLGGALQKVAAGELESPLPPAGQDEIGLLAKAVHQFREMALASHHREQALKEAQGNQATAERQRNMLIARISHDLRSPLHGILRSSNQLIELEGNDKVVEKIVSNSTATLKLLDDLIDFSRLEQGSLSVFAEPFYLHRLVSGLIDHGEELARETDFSFNSNVCPDLPIVIRGAEDRIRQIIRNLIENAFRHGKSDVDFKVDFSLKGEKGYFTFVVRDHGNGISESERSNLFKPFRQGKTQSSALGSGLGLTIASELAGLIGGGLIVENTSGGGATFKLTFPADILTEGDVDFSESFGVEKIFDLSQVFLVVDDQEEQRELIEEYLLLAGAEVLVAENFQEAFSLARQQNIDCLITDQFMPDGTGADLLETIQKMDGYENLPAVMVTSAGLNVSSNDQNKFFSVLSKPVIPGHFVSTVQKALNNYRF